MSGLVRVRLVAEDRATPVVTKFANASKSSFSQVAKSANTASATVTTGMQKMGASTSAATNNLTKFVRQVTLLTAAVNVFKTGAKEAAGFEFAVARLQTLGAALGGSYEEVVSRIRELGPEFGNQTQLANALFEAITKGATDIDTAFEILRVSAVLAKGQLSDLNKTTGLTQQIAAAYGLTLDEIAEKMNKVAKVTQFGNVTFEQLIQPLGLAIPTAETMGITIEDLANTIGTLAITMGSADRAGTAVNNMLLQATKRSAQLREAGVDVQKVLGEGGIVSLMEALRDATAGNADELLELVPAIRAFRGAAALTGPLLEKLRSNMVEVNKESNIVALNAEIMKNTVSGAFTIMTDASKNFASRLLNDDSVDIQNALITIANGFILAGNNIDKIGATLQVFSGIATFVASVATEAFRRLWDMITLGPRLVSSGLEAVNSKLSDLADAAGFVVEKLGGENTKVAEIMDRLSETFDETAQRNKNFADGIGDTSDSIGEFASNLRGATLEAFVKAEEGFTATGESAKFLELRTKEGIQALRDQREAMIASSDAAKQSAEQNDKASASVEKLGRNTDKAMQQVADTTEEALDRVSQGFKMVDGVWTDATGNMNKQTKGWATITADSTQEVRSKISNVGGVYKNVAEEVDEGVKKIAKTTSENLSKTAQNTQRFSKDVNAAMKSMFGTTPKQIENDIKTIIKDFTILRETGLVQAEALRDGLQQKFDQIARIVGPDSPLLDGLKELMKEIEREIGGGLSKVEKITEDSISRLMNQWQGLGDDVGQSAFQIGRDYQTAFGIMVDRGRASKDKLKDIFQNEVKPALEAAGIVVPQAWEARFGEVAQAGEAAADRVENAFEDLANNSGSIASRFSGTWVEQLGNISGAVDNLGNSLTQLSDISANDILSDTGEVLVDRDTGIGFGLENTQTSNNVQALLNDLAELDEAMRTTVGSAPNVVAARELFLDEIRKVEARLRELGFDPQGNPLDQGPGGGGGQQTPPGFTGSGTASRARPASAVPFEETPFGMAGAISDEIEIQRERQRRLTQPLSDLFAAVRQGESSLTALEQIAKSFTDRIASGEQLTSLEATRHRDTLATIAQIQDRIGDSQTRIREIRAVEAGIVENIARLEAERAAILENLRPMALEFTVPSGAAGSTGPPQTSTDDNTSAVESNTDAIDNLTDQLGPGEIGVREPGIETGAFGVPSAGRDDDLNPFGFANGGTVFRSGNFQLEEGETVVPRQGEMDRSGVRFLGRGETTVSSGPGGVANTSFMGNVEQQEIQYFNHLASQGRIQDLIGPRGQEHIAQAIIGPTKAMIRRRDIMADLTRNTPLTQQGAATVK